jgi:4-alpha-glucanotransferase
MKRRSSGILLHITSLPSDYFIGDMGQWAYKFADFLVMSGQNYWQILPLNPTDTVCGNSPYSSVSAFASNPVLISPELLVEDGFIDRKSIEAPIVENSSVADYGKASVFKNEILKKAFEKFKKNQDNGDFKRFCIDNSYWLDDYSLFIVLKKHFKFKVWCEWPHEFRDRNPESMKWALNEFAEEILFEKFVQFIFDKQWEKLKNYCNNKGLQIIGDLPIYVQFDSADIWANPGIVKLDHEKKPYAVAGVPPDYFSDTGQLWGNPVYEWDYLKKTGFEWWIKRIKHVLCLYDIVRIDHFRGLVAYWEVPVWERTAVNGKWVEVPVKDFFDAVYKMIPVLPLIGEDLGIITSDVREIMNVYDIPGMKVLVFAFGDDMPKNPYIPHNVQRESLMYTGTHDTNTVRGWFENETSYEMRKRLFEYIGKEVNEKEISMELVRLAMMSPSNIAVIPLQDILGLDADSRMNFPSTPSGNWCWRFLPEMLKPEISSELLKMTLTYGRTS